jgi:hypothetical protein
MKANNWKDTAELLGIAAITASLIFVGLELRQSQRIAYAEQEGSQITDFMAVDELISSKANLILKLNRGEELTAVESIESERLILSIDRMMFFTNQRAFYLDHPSFGAAERGLAILLFQNPGLRALWANVRESDERYMRALGGFGSSKPGSFGENVRAHLETLDRIE